MWHSGQRIACLWLSALSLLLMLIGFFTPGWVIYTETANSTYSTTTSLNVWYAVVCVKETQGSLTTESCVSQSYVISQNALKQSDGYYNDMANAYDNLVPAEIETTLGVLVCIVAVFSVFIAFTYWCESWYCCSMRNYMGAAAFAFLVSGVLVYVPTGQFARSNDLLDNYADLKMGVPYSVILMAIGGFLAFVIMLILVTMLCSGSHHHHTRPRRHRYSDSDYSDYKYDDRHSRPYSIAEPPRYYEKPYRIPERSLPPPRVYEKRPPPGYYINSVYDDSHRKFDRPYGRSLRY